jgi:hypothetical protein
MSPALHQCTLTAVVETRDSDPEKTGYRHDDFWFARDPGTIPTCAANRPKEPVPGWDFSPTVGQRIFHNEQQYKLTFAKTGTRELAANERQL